MKSTPTRYYNAKIEFLAFKNIAKSAAVLHPILIA